MNLLNGNGSRLRRSVAGRLGVASTSTSVTCLIIGCLAVLMIFLSFACNGPTPTETPPTHEHTKTPTPTDTPSLTAFLTPTLIPTAAATSIATLIPTATATLTATLTPTPSPTLTPTTRVPPPVAQLELIAPLQWETYPNSIVFQWKGGPLRAGQAYQVTAYHLETLYMVQSDPLVDQSWTKDLPKELVGAWYWRVSVVKGGSELTTTSEWLFYFDPCYHPTPSGGNGEQTATATPEHE